ncbi:MAG: hypothetical protein BWX80_02967 [Candidatus Hydrogenedentes bacterium ADurb.Bin101]|nr:MAG: hypothetical protein BWX80_02967 [Candidatus Hydrogenedentes bacterium ADurb.Bin101]
MELAVNMPEQQPHPGQAFRSSSSSSLSLIWPRVYLPTPSNTVIRSAGLPLSSLPARMGPPETNTVGMLQRMAPISMPGVILSQFGMHSSASNWWARIMDSTQSAISSREGRLYFMPV